MGEKSVAATATLSRGSFDYGMRVIRRRNCKTVTWRPQWTLGSIHDPNT
jgi:hypothetical protein